MKIIIADVETTGLFGKNQHYSTDFALFPKIVSIAWQLLDEDQKLFNKEYHVIRPDGYEIPEESQVIHGISTEQAIACGKDMKTILRHFIIDAQEADKIVIHNAFYDCSVIKANLLCLGVDKNIANEALAKEKRVDTMMKTIKFVGAEYANGNPGKWPRQEELYFKLFQEEMKGAHDSENDVENLKKCYYELLRLKIL